MEPQMKHYPGSDILASNFAEGKQTFLIPLTFEDVRVAKDTLERISYGGDIWELRVDLLKDPTDTAPSALPRRDYVSAQLHFLKQSSDLPIIFTIRTKGQGGKFPDDAREEAFDLICMALEKGCEYVDIECDWSADFIDNVVSRKGSSKIIASYHDWTGTHSWKDVWSSKRAALQRYGDILKLSPLLTNSLDCHQMALDMAEYREHDVRPVIMVGMGTCGQLSRVVSPVSFVTHRLLPSPSAPGQMTLAQVHQCQNLIGTLPSKSFFIFGNKISHSLSPTIHNTAFSELGLPHNYSIFETPQLDAQVRKTIERPDFGGASVTSPHKLQIQPFLDSLSEAAAKIGAVNTIIVQENTSGRKLLGDNTDWIGLLNLIKKSGKRPDGNAVVVGAGGAARAAVFALQTFGWKEIKLINRSRATAEALAGSFPALGFEIFGSFSEVPPASVIIGCIPADGIRESDIPQSLFEDSQGVVIEMSYFPTISAMMQVASKRKWRVYGGVDVLREQAYAQFELWTGRRAPVSVIEEALDAHTKAKI